MAGKGFFDQVAIKDDPVRLWKTSMAEADGERLAKLILGTLTPVASFVERHKLSLVPDFNTWTADVLCGYKGDILPYSGRARRSIVEVVDVPPHYAGSTRESPFYSVERIVGIYTNPKKPGQRGTVFIRLSPMFSPSVNFVLDNQLSNMGFIPSVPSAPKVEAVVDTLVKAIDEAVPTPPWVGDFEESFDVRDRTIYKKPSSTLDFH